MNNQKLISDLQSFADRLKKDKYSSTMFEGDWDTLIDAMDLINYLTKRNEHWIHQYFIENEKWKSAEKNLSDLLIKMANNTTPQTKPLSFEEIEDCFPDDGCSTTEDGWLKVSAQFLHDFARAIEERILGK